MSASNKEIANILAAIDAGGTAHHEMALATVVDVEGSSYRRTGARMLILQNGTWIGAISGGCLEGNALRRTREVMRTQTAQHVTYDTRTDESAKAIGASLGCNGIIHVWIEPLGGKPAIDALRQLQKAFFAEKETWFARLIEVDAELQAGEIFVLNDLGQESPYPVQHLHREEGLQTLRWAGKSLRFAVERVQPALKLVLFGAGDDVRPLAALADQMGWRVTVTDDCPAKTLPKRFPEAERVVHLDRHTAADALKPDAYTAAVLISHNYGYDKVILEGLLAHDLAYIGILGPRKRFERMDAELGGVLMGNAAIHAPIGLDIGAQTPFEIALAIVAEVQAKFAGRAGGSLRARTGSIHERKALQI